MLTSFTLHWDICTELPGDKEPTPDWPRRCWRRSETRHAAPSPRPGWCRWSPRRCCAWRRRWLTSSRTNILLFLTASWATNCYWRFSSIIWISLSSKEPLSYNSNLVEIYSFLSNWLVLKIDPELPTYIPNLQILNFIIILIKLICINILGLMTFHWR